MKRLALTFAALVAFCAAHAAHAAKPCEELKTAIAAKLDEKGVKDYSLEIVETDKVAADAKVIGSCDAGTKKITYART